ncbi:MULTISPECIES: hypothetical protein [unclassified Streptomyces]|uniref:hypothetical protein n=1 Tax=unclassified Streptomyces TaxID=2593676 RepID=UPI0005F979F3|nr:MULTISPECIES: hypothetical protein [unclassified Streptomyces]KJY30837.1 hypothetical protein VR45_26785 [Streptomyces sp. NRRL S-495]KOV35935.1 hypothetical protein ADK60_07885 [Streptomyces sp. XY431]
MVLVELRCSAKVLFYWKNRACASISGEYTLSKDGKVIQQTDRFAVAYDPDSGKDERWEAYQCQGGGTYTLKFTDAAIRVDHEDGLVYPSDITLTAEGC